MKMNRRAEDYMKVIYRLRDKGPVRGVDIAREFGVSKPTVSVALKKMEASGLIAFHSENGIELSEKGEWIAREVIERYDALYGFLLDLGVDEHTAHEDACRMEHGISETSLAALKELRQYLRHSQFKPESQSNNEKDDSL